MTVCAIPLPGKRCGRSLSFGAALALIALLALTPAGAPVAAQTGPASPAADIPLFGGLVRLAAGESILAIVANRRFELPQDAAPFATVSKGTGQATLMIRASGRFSETGCAGSEVFGLGHSLVTDQVADAEVRSPRVPCLTSVVTLFAAPQADLSDLPFYGDRAGLKARLVEGRPSHDTPGWPAATPLSPNAARELMRRGLPLPSGHSVTLRRPAAPEPGPGPSVLFGARGHLTFARVLPLSGRVLSRDGLLVTCPLTIRITWGPFGLSRQGRQVPAVGAECAFASQVVPTRIHVFGTAAAMPDAAFADRMRRLDTALAAVFADYLTGPAGAP